MIRLVAVDDDLMMMGGFCNWITTGADDIDVVMTAARVPPVIRARPVADVVLLDLQLRDGSRPASNVESLLGIGYRVLMVSTHHDPLAVVDTFTAGASGYVTKNNNLDALVSAIRTVAAGEDYLSRELAFALAQNPAARRPDLSDQERAMVKAYSSGLTLEAASRSIGVASSTGKEYLERVKAKYRSAGRSAQTKLELVNRLREDGIW